MREVNLGSEYRLGSGLADFFRNGILFYVQNNMEGCVEMVVEEDN